MVYITISAAGIPEDARRDAIDAVVRARGGRTTWRTNPLVGRSYASIELPSRLEAAAIPTAPGEVVYESAIIAWAVFPTVPEALPHLYDALGGPGRPSSILACRPLPDGAIVECDPDSGGIEVVLKVVDVELHRFRSGRRAEVLSPLPPSVTAQIAAGGLQTLEISADRILELLIDRSRTPAGETNATRS